MIDLPTSGPGTGKDQKKFGFVMFCSPGREAMQQRAVQELERKFPWSTLHTIGDQESFGKRNFWQRMKRAFEFCLASDHDDFVIIPDDFTNFDAHIIRTISKDFEGRPFVANLANDGRKHCWGSYPGETIYDSESNKWLNLGFTDCGMITNRATLERITIEPVPESWFNTESKSSGVGHQLTTKFRALGVPMLTPEFSLVYHGQHESVMHPHERKTNPLVTINRPLPKVACIATFAGRESSLQRTIDSLRNQVDHIFIYDNEILPDRKDNGKFYALDLLDIEGIGDCYYFTCDDDILYPSNYVDRTVKAIEKHKTIITHHGRKLKSLDVSYYYGHKSISCLHESYYEGPLDVAGTGVTAFDTRYFKPVDLYASPDLKMSDLIFSLEAALQGKDITIVKHEYGWLKQLPIDVSTSIHATESRKETRQIEIANQIYKLRYEQKD